MKRLRLLLPLLLLLLLPLSAQASMAVPNRVIVGQDYSLASGEKVNTNLIVVGGDLNMDAGSVVTGNVTVTGGDARVDGRIDGNLIVVGGDLQLGSQANVRGNVIIRGGHLRKAETAKIGGRISKGNFHSTLNLFPFHEFGQTSFSFGGSLLGLIWWAFKTVLTALIAALLAWVVMMLWPQGVAGTAEVMQREGVLAFVVGLVLLTILSLAAAIAIITICLSLAGLLILLLLFVAGIVGWAAIGKIVGESLLSGLDLNVDEQQESTLAAALGVFLLVLVSRGIPCLGPLFALIIDAIAVGALALYWSHRPNA